MKKYITAAAVSLIGLAGAATAADAVSHGGRHSAETARPHKHNPQMHPKGGLPHDLQELNLSSRQKAQIQKIMEANCEPRAENRPAPDAARQAEFHRKMQQHREAERTLITAKRFDEAAARRLTDERRAEFGQEAAKREQLMADMEIKRLKERHDIFQVLTAKQQKQWLDNQQKHRRHPGMQGEPRPETPPAP